MAKVTNKKVEIAGEDITLEIHWSDKYLFHVKKGIPSRMDKLVKASWKWQGKASKSELDTAIRDVIAEYSICIESERSVLIVGIILGTETARSLDIPESHKIRGHWMGMTPAPKNFGYDFKYTKAKEVTVGTAFKYLDEYGGQIHTTERDLVIDYTPDREVFLQQFVDASVALGAKLFSLFGTEAKQLAETIDTNPKLLNA